MEFGATFKWSYGSERLSEYREYKTANGYKRFMNHLKNSSCFENVRVVVKTHNNETVKVDS